MIESISFYDGGSEGFYHGLILGICAIMNNKYYIKSNGEVGYGRFDIQLIPKIKNMPGFIFELKHAKTKDEDLDLLAINGLKQITDKKYDNNMIEQNISKIVKISIAFHGKKAVVKNSAK